MNTILLLDNSKFVSIIYLQPNYASSSLYMVSLGEEASNQHDSQSLLHLDG